MLPYAICTCMAVVTLDCDILSQCFLKGLVLLLTGGGKQHALRMHRGSAGEMPPFDQT